MISKSFEAAGISPLNQNVILQRYKKHRERQQREGSTSSSSFSDTNWPRVKRLIHSIEIYPTPKKGKKLRHIYHSMHVKTDRHDHEIKGLRADFRIRKKQKNNHTTLGLPKRQKYQGEAVFWSLRKIREAHARQVVKEREDSELRLQKEGRARVRATNKILRQQLGEEKRVAGEERENEREQRRAEERAKQR